MAKRIDPLKAKQKKQKKLAIGLGVVLVAVVAFQGPKTLKMLQGPQPVASPATTTAAPTTPAPATATGGTPAAPTGTPPAAQPAVLADSDLPPLAGDGQLESFELFRSKDPFAQQVDENAVGGSAGSSGTSSSDEPRELPPVAVDAPPTQGAVTGGSPSAPSTPSAAAEPEKAGPELASATSISVNGRAEDVEVKATFPAAEPTFQLVSVARDGKSVRIAIAGGSYADGSATIELELRKPLTLQNTADGTRYVIELKTVEGFPLPKKSK